MAEPPNLLADAHRNNSAFLSPGVDQVTFQGTTLVHGNASGTLIGTDLPLSFWGGVDPATGEVIDRHHPLSGCLLQDAILAIPGGRGSCSGSGVVLELLLNGRGPKGLIFARREDILTLGVIVAEEIFSKSIPVVVFSEIDFQTIVRASHVCVQGDKVTLLDSPSIDESFQPKSAVEPRIDREESVRPSDSDRAILMGSKGEAARMAMRIVLRMAHLLGATQLLDVTQVHIDGCVYTGQASLAFAEKLKDLGGQVVVPTTLNSISVDQKRWRSQGVDVVFGDAAERLGAAYTAMGASPTFTCAPYLLQSAPKRGEQIAWAESNAVVYANSVLGARTMKYPDFLDISIALTGRAPYGGLHLAENRQAAIVISACFKHNTSAMEDSFWPILGYACGKSAGHRIPAIAGLEHYLPTTDDLKAFGAAFATVSSAPMFHIVGITPEAPELTATTSLPPDLPATEVTFRDIELCWRTLNTAPVGRHVDLISLGNPHFSIVEIRRLANLCSGRSKCGDVTMVVTCGRSTYRLAVQAGLIERLEIFGVQFVTDTCWCMMNYEPIITHSTTVIMTNSAKYAHYGPGLTGKDFYFGSLAQCVQAACKGLWSFELQSFWHDLSG